MSSQVSGRYEEFRKGGRVLLGSMIGAGCGLSSVSFYTHGVFTPVIAADTGWGRGQVQSGVTIMILMAVITAPLAGMLVDRLGARCVALWSIPLYAITLAALAFSGSSLPMFYLAWVVMSVLAAGTLPVTWTRLVNAWFDRYRGIALGITLVGTGIAATIGPVYVTWLIEEYGWRSAYVLLGVTVLCIGFPAVWRWFRAPTDESEPTRMGGLLKEVPGLQPREAYGSYRFWVIGIGLVLAAAGISGLITNFVPMLTDRGLTAGVAAGYAGVIGISVIVGRLVVGLLVDRFWAPGVAAIFLCAPAIAALVLAGDSLPPSLIVVSAAIIGLAAGAELDLLAYLASRYFGLRHYGALYGSLYVFFALGAGLAPATFGFVFDLNASYSPILKIVAIMSVSGGLMMLTLGAYPRCFARSSQVA
jgi:MFS family permease